MTYIENINTSIIDKLVKYEIKNSRQVYLLRADM